MSKTTQSGSAESKCQKQYLFLAAAVIILGIILNTIFVYLVLKSANWIERKLGDGTLQVLQKVFGIILLAISIKLFTTNFAQLITTYVKF